MSQCPSSLITHPEDVVVVAAHACSTPLETDAMGTHTPIASTPASTADSTLDPIFRLVLIMDVLPSSMPPTCPCSLSVDLVVLGTGDGRTRRKSNVARVPLKKPRLEEMKNPTAMTSMSKSLWDAVMGIRTAFLAEKPPKAPRLFAGQRLAVPPPHPITPSIPSRRRPHRPGSQGRHRTRRRHRAVPCWLPALCSRGGYA